MKLEKFAKLKGRKVETFASAEEAEAAADALWAEITEESVPADRIGCVLRRLDRDTGAPIGVVSFELSALVLPPGYVGRTSGA